MLVSLQGARIDGVLSFFFLKQVSSDLLQVWVLVCCVFIFAVDCIWDYCPVVLCSSSCWGMNHKINSVMKTVPRIHNLGQKLLRILQLFRIVPSGCLSGRFGTAMTSLLAPPLSLLFSQGQKLSSWTSTLFFGGRGKTEVFVINSFLKNFILKLDIVTSIFRNIFAQDYRIDLACLTFFNTYLVTFSWIWFIFICLVIWIFYCSVVLFRIIIGGGDRSWLAAVLPCISSCTLSISSSPSWPSVGRPPPSCTLVIPLSWF